MTVDLAATLDLIGRQLDRDGIPWAVIGGLAISAYGSARSTFDVDVVLPRREQERVLLMLDALAFETIHCSAGFSNHHHEARGRVDIVWVDDETARKLFAAAERKRVLGRDVQVPAAEHLVAMKVAAYVNEPERRLQDLADIRTLVRHARLDRETVARVLERYGRLEDLDHVVG